MRCSQLHDLPERSEQTMKNSRPSGLWTFRTEHEKPKLGPPGTACFMCALTSIQGIPDHHLPVPVKDMLPWMQALQMRPLGYGFGA